MCKSSVKKTMSLFIHGQSRYLPFCSSENFPDPDFQHCGRGKVVNPDRFEPFRTDSRRISSGIGNQPIEDFMRICNADFKTCLHRNFLDKGNLKKMLKCTTYTPPSKKNPTSEQHINGTIRKAI